MSRTLFLDIDGVLMAHTTQPPNKRTGFTDWRKLDRKTRPFGWAGWISDEQQALILDVFGHNDDRIVWLTTWELSAYTPGGANGAFSDEINWKRHDTFDDEWLEAAFNLACAGPTWWKQDILHRAHTMKHEYVAADHIVWVDDELVRQQSLDSRAMLAMHRAEGTYTTVGPDPAWSRDSIESFRIDRGAS